MVFRIQKCLLKENWKSGFPASNNIENTIEFPFVASSTENVFVAVREYLILDLFIMD